MIRSLRWAVLLASAVTVAGASDTPPQELALRGQAGIVSVYPAPTDGRLPGSPAPLVLFTPGDGGMRGYAVTLARTIAGFGYDVYAMSTRDYLKGSSSSAPLTTAGIASDYRRVAERMRRGRNDRVALVGWSEGAGLSLAAAADSANKEVFSGLIVFGLEETNSLGWHWTDLITTITHGETAGAHFASSELLPRVHPLPFMMIQSTGDEYVAVADAQAMFARASEPKRFELIDAKDHRFGGNEQLFYRTLQNGLSWLESPTR